MMAFGWALFLLAASQELSIVPYLLAAGIAGIVGFSLNNLSAEIAALAPAGGVAGWWFVVAGLAAYLAWVVVWWRLASRTGV
jgi:hypothetical protein